jgi:hypothetical protein
MATRKPKPAPEWRPDPEDTRAFMRAVDDQFINTFTRTTPRLTPRTLILHSSQVETTRQTRIEFRPQGMPFTVLFREELRIYTVVGGETDQFIQRWVNITVDGHWTDTVECFMEARNSKLTRLQTKAGSGGRMTSPDETRPDCVGVEHDEDALDNLTAAISYVTQLARDYRTEMESRS